MLLRKPRLLSSIAKCFAFFPTTHRASNDFLKRVVLGTRVSQPIEPKIVFAPGPSEVFVQIKMATKCNDYLTNSICPLNIKAGVNVKVVLASLNTAFLSISRSRFKQHEIRPSAYFSNHCLVVVC